MKLKIKGIILIMVKCISFAHSCFGQKVVPGSVAQDTLQNDKQIVQQKLSSEISGLNDSVQSIVPIEKLKGDAASIWNQPKKFQQELGAKVNLFTNAKAIQLNKVVIDANFSYAGDTTQLSLFPYQPQSIWSFRSDLDLALFHMPFVFNYEGNNGLYTFGHSPLNSFDQFNFDPVRYRDQLQALALQKIKPEVVLGSIMKRINEIRSNYEASLQKEISDIAKQYREQYKHELKLPSEVTDLSINDLSSLQTKILGSANLDQYRQNITRAQELLDKETVPASIADSGKQVVLAEVKKVEALQDIYKKVVNAKAKFEDNKIVKELRSHLPFTPANYQSYLKNPGNLSKVIRDHASLSSLQSLFLNITKLDLGKNAVNSGALSLQNLVNNGINTAFKNEKMGLGFIYGTNANSNNWLQSGLSSFVSNEYSRMGGITLSNGNKTNLDQFISMNFFDFRNDPQLSNTGALLQSFYLAQGQRKDAVLTVHSGWPIAANSKIIVDLSRSFGSYAQSSSLDSSFHKPNTVKSLFSNEGSDNYAGSVSFEGEIMNTPVTLHLSKIGLGYNNPGNVFLRRGETQIGGGVKRKLLHKKLSLQYSLDYRDQSFDPESIYAFHTLSNKFKAAYRMNRYANFGFTFSNSNYTSIHQNTSSQNGINRRFELQGTYRLQVFDQVITCNDNISHQVMSVPVITGATYNSRSYLLVHSSSMILKNNLLSLSVMGNRSSNESYYFNTSFFNADLNYTYAVGKGMRMGSGVGYYDNSGWNRQIGVLQQISFSKQRLSFNLDASYKKAIYVIRKDLANQLYLTTSLHYQFN